MRDSCKNGGNILFGEVWARIALNHLLDHVLKLTDIQWPVKCLQQLDGVRVETNDVFFRSVL